MDGRILIVDDDRSMTELLEDALTRRGFQTVCVPSAHHALAALEGGAVDVVVTDLNMPGLDGVALCERVTACRPDLPVIVVTAFGSMETAVAAMRAGAYDFVTKPFEVETLALALRRAVSNGALRVELRRLRRAVAEAQRFGDLLGGSEAMARVYQLIERVADSDTSVLVTGESGTGKEVVARALHRRSHRRGGPFVAVNCAAMPEALLESELFGHVKGAFTDARSAHAGLFVQAHGGTLFLDELGDMPLGLQPKLLRALQERVVRPVGGNAEVPVDVRIIAATNRDLEGLVDERRFREDLYFRVNVIHLELPPLRARGSDVLLLARDCIARSATRAGRSPPAIAPAAEQKLLAYSWPGNVRELQNCMERAVAFARDNVVDVGDLPERVREHRPTNVLVTGSSPAELVSMDEVERRYMLRVLEAVGGNKTQAAQILGVDRRTLYRKLVRFAAPPEHRTRDVGA